MCRLDSRLPIHKGKSEIDAWAKKRYKRALDGFLKLVGV